MKMPIRPLTRLAATVLLCLALLTIAIAEGEAKETKIAAPTE